MSKQKLTNIIKKGIKEKKDLNCAETILYGANQAYNLNLDENDLKVAAGFGGGMGRESVCGALTGAIMALGLVFVEDTAHKSNINDLSNELFTKFEQRMGSIQCAPLKKDHRTLLTGCKKVILAAAEVMDEIMEQYKKVTS